MKVEEIIDIIESWAPRRLAWENDNPGLQCGRRSGPLDGILVSLDPTEAVVREAVRRKRSMVVTHHPLLFRPLKTVDTGNATGRIIATVLQHDMTLYAAHTNLDFTVGGTSFALAEVLGLQELRFLKSDPHASRKIVTFVPPDHVEEVAHAMAAAGAGSIGKYTECSFRTTGEGTFRGNATSAPTIGTAGNFERVREVRLEMVVPAWRVDAVVKALRRTHPYEEIAYDILTSEVPAATGGAGVIGTLPHPAHLSAFLRKVRRTLGTGALRYAGNAEARVQRIAVCGGSGAELFDDAMAAHADVFLTADIKYHDFQRTAGSCALVDAGHFETEFPVVPVMAERLRNALRTQGVRIPVDVARQARNPVAYA